MKCISFAVLLLFNYVWIIQAKIINLSEKFLCKGKNGGLIPMARSCRGYYICIDGNSFVGSCDQNYHFNPLTLRCDHAENVPCEFKDISEREEIFNNEKLAIIKPHKPKPEKQQVKVESESMFSTDIDNLCVGQRNGVLFAKSKVCNQYYICENAIPRRRQCPPNLHFSATRHLCTTPEIAKCMEIMKPPTEVNIEKEKPLMTPVENCTEDSQNDFVSHHRDCGKFFLCSNMLLLEMSCPPGLHFSTEKNRCDYPKTAKCAL